MQTDDLTTLLCDDLKPASRALVPGLLLLGLVAGLILVHGADGTGPGAAS